MTLKRRRVLVALGMWADMLALFAALVLAEELTYRPMLHQDTVVIAHPLRQLVLVLGLLWSWHAALQLSGLYRSHRLSTLRLLSVHMLRALGGVTLCTLLWQVLEVAVASRKTVWNLDTTRVLIGWVLLAGVYLLTTRVAARGATRVLRRHGRNLRHVLIIGTNQRALRAADTLVAERRLGYRLAGFVDDVWHSASAPEHYKAKRLGSLDDLASILESTPLDEVIITLPVASAYQRIRTISQQCREQGILVRCEVSLFTFDTHQPDGPANALQFATLHEYSWSLWAVALKRVLDLSVAMVAVLLASPVLLALAVAIRVTSPGPILFQQQRLGLGKRMFTIYKFRTMVIDAEARMQEVEHLNQTAGPTFKLARDPRITVIGSFLRRTSLDELPQLFNVLLGDMSLVGPRPLPLRDYRGFSEDWQRRRFSVKPGITCLWQIMGRSSITFERWMELDMTYIDSWSPWLDVKILLQTIPAVLRGSGAV